MPVPDPETLTAGGVIVIAFDRMIALVKAAQARRNGGDTNELLHKIREEQVRGNVWLENLVEEVRNARR